MDQPASSRYIIYMYIHVYIFLMRDEKGERKKQARSNKQTRQSNTAHPRQSLFLEKMSMYMLWLFMKNKIRNLYVVLYFYKPINMADLSPLEKTAQLLSH